MLRIKKGETAEKLLAFVGLCGEVPVVLLRQWDGYYDYNRRLVTRLVREGYLRERKMRGYKGRTVRSLSITDAGLGRLRDVSPVYADVIGRHVLAPEQSYGVWKKALRLHRGAWCLLTAMKLGAVWMPGKEKRKAQQSGRLCYFTAYELDRYYGWDNKGVRASGVFCLRQFFYPVYYLGSHNMRWNETVEEWFCDRLEQAWSSRGCSLKGALFLSEDWPLAANLMHTWVWPRTKMIHSAPYTFSYCVPVDQNGLRVLRLILDESALIYFHRYLTTHNINAYDHDEDFLFELNRLASFVRWPGKKNLHYPDLGLFFDFQLKTAAQLNDFHIKLKTIPGIWLEHSCSKYLGADDTNP